MNNLQHAKKLLEIVSANGSQECGRDCGGLSPAERLSMQMGAQALIMECGNCKFFLPWDRINMRGTGDCEFYRGKRNSLNPMDGCRLGWQQRPAPLAY